MTHYLSGNLKSRHIFSDNDGGLERANNCNSELLFFFTATRCKEHWSHYMWSEEQQDEETKCDHFKCCLWALQGVRNPLSLQIRKAIRHVDVSGSYLTVLWWRRSRTRECLHPRYWRLLVWSRSGSWGLWEKEKDGGNKLMQPPHQPKLLRRSAWDCNISRASISIQSVLLQPL